MSIAADNEHTPLLSKVQTSRSVHQDRSIFHLARPISQDSNVLAEAIKWQATDVNNPPDDTKRSGKALSESGRRVVGDARSLLLERKEFGEAKNADDKFQEVWYHSRRSRMGTKADVPAPESRKDLTEDYHRLLRSLGTISRVFLTSALTTSPATLLSDAAESISQPLAEVADTLRPTEEERKRAAGLQEDVNEGKEVVQQVLGAPETDGTIPEQAKKVIAQEVEDQAVERFRMLFEHMQTDPSFQPAFITLIDLAYKYTTQTSSAASSTLASVSLSDPSQHTRAALHNLRLIVEALSNRSLNPLTKALDTTVKAITADPDLSVYFKALDDHVRRVLTDRPYASTVAAIRRTQEIYRQGQELLRIKPEWKKAATDLLTELQLIINGILTDKHVNNLALAVQKVITDTIGMGYVVTSVAKGEAIAVWRDITDVILPAVARVIQCVPMPRFEFDSPDVAFVLDDVIFESANFFPDHFRFTTSNDVQVSTAPDEPTEFDSTMRIRFDGLRINIHDVPFWVSLKKYSWFPPFKEQYGIIDFSILKSGLGMDIELRLPADLETGIYTVENVSVSITDLDFSLRDSKYSWLAWLLRPVLRWALKLGLKLVLQQCVRTGLEQLDQAIWEYKLRKEQWEDQGMNPREAATNAVFIGDAPYAEANDVNGDGDGDGDIKSLLSLEGVEISGKGIIKRDEETGMAIALGAEQILPGVGGPPTKWGRSSVDRRAAMVEAEAQGKVDDLEDTAEEARDLTRKAQALVDKVDLQSMVDVTAEERREEAGEAG